MGIRNLLVLLLITIFLVGCNQENQNDSIGMINKLDEQDVNQQKVEELEKSLNSLVQEKEKLEVKLKETEDQNIILENLVDDLETKILVSEDLKVYKDLYTDLRRYLDLNLELTEANNLEKPSINGAYIGFNYNDIKNLFGDSYNEVLMSNRMGYSENYGFISWEYEDGTRILFDPVSVVEIETSNPEHITNFGVQIGDSALQAIKYCDDNFEQIDYVGTPNVGWYYVGDYTRLILYFNTDNNPHQNDIFIDEESKVERIELSTVILD